MASTALPKNIDLVNMIAGEMAYGVEKAVECWMAQIEEVLGDAHLTSLGRLNAVNDIVRRYKSLTGKTKLRGRKALVRDEF